MKVENVTRECAIAFEHPRAYLLLIRSTHVALVSLRRFLRAQLVRLGTILDARGRGRRRLVECRPLRLWRRAAVLGLRSFLGETPLKHLPLGSGLLHAAAVPYI